MFAIDDCKTANGVEYCYCNVDLCNGHRKPVTAKHNTFLMPDKISDDEDDDDTEFESSGIGSTPLIHTKDDEDWTTTTTLTNRLNVLTTANPNAHLKSNTSLNKISMFCLPIFMLMLILF